jgi:hypothetical protein
MKKRPGFNGSLLQAADDRIQKLGSKNGLGFGTVQEYD